MTTETERKCRHLFEDEHVQSTYRLVPAFTFQSQQRNVKVIPPPKVNVYEKRPRKKTNFFIYFKRGDIPVCSAISQGKTLEQKQQKGQKQFPIKWLCDPDKIDYCYYLPVFIDGLADRNEDIRTLAQHAAMDLIIRGPNKIYAVLPRVILPFKRAFNTNNKKIIVTAFKVLQLMVLLGPCVGRALVPFYRQLLPVCNLFKQVNVNLGGGVDNNRDDRIGDVIEDTLQILERCGGPDAYINIKYIIPTYESCVRN